MYGLTFDLFLGALVAATFGFGGIPTRWAGLARVLFVVLLFGFGLRVAIDKLEANYRAWFNGSRDKRSEGIGNTVRGSALPGG